MGERQRELMLGGDRDAPAEPAQRPSDDVGEPFERIRAQLAACWGPEPMAKDAA
jgi:hypothetical protein